MILHFCLGDERKLPTKDKLHVFTKLAVVLAGPDKRTYELDSRDEQVIQTGCAIGGLDIARLNGCAGSGLAVHMALGDNKRVKQTLSRKLTLGPITF